MGCDIERGDTDEDIIALARGSLAGPSFSLPLERRLSPPMTSTKWAKIENSSR